MNVEELRLFCLSFEKVEEKFPFDESTLVFYTGNKMFALVDLDSGDSVNLKCDPQKSIDLRERFVGVVPGYHMNKKHWNSVYLQKDVPDNMIRDMVRESYCLVRASLPKKFQ